MMEPRTLCSKKVDAAPAPPCRLSALCRSCASVAAPALLLPPLRPVPQLRSCCRPRPLCCDYAPSAPGARTLRRRKLLGGYSSRILYPTPISVKMYSGSAGFFSIFRRIWAMLTRSIWLLLSL